MKRFIYIIFFLFLVFSCNKKTTDKNLNQVENITIDTKRGDFYLYDDVYEDNVHFVKLETNNDNLIGEISNMFFDDNRIFIVDSYKTMSIFIFDMEGNYLTKIANQGNGPGEFSMIYHVFLDKKKKEIVVVDTPQQKNIHYSYTGKYLYEERHPFSIISCEYLESGHRAYYTGDLITPDVNNNNILVVTDSLNNIVYTACSEFYSDSFALTQVEKFWTYDDELFFYPSFADTIFHITDTAAVAKYYIDVVPEKMPNPSKINNLTRDLFIKEYLDKYYYFGKSFIQLQDFTYLELHGFGPKIIYSHNTNNTYMALDMLNLLFYFYKTPITRYGHNKIVVSSPPTQILHSKKYLYRNVHESEEDGHTSLSKKINLEFLDSLYFDLKEEDNPVLFFYEIKSEL